ncbi:MAG TPA: ATP-binding cassette domain-containing protein [Thermomicrobiales bacterium]|nr:ATP-binding cassette domain-containing protein [Thermomicrobiales bacterium]
MTFLDGHPSHPAIEAISLSKRFGTTQALDDVSFHVPQGTILGLLGPNGSGKSTTVRALTTLLLPDSGTGRVNGIDVVQDAERARFQFGLASQSATVDELLTGRDNLILIGQLFQMPASRARQRADELLERFGLSDAADRRAKTYSGGMRRRLDLASSLVAAPPVLFLDEPTTGLDPRSRLQIWDAIAQLVREGTTVLLTTQYLEEADFLADRIVVIDHGRVIANDTPRNLKRSVGGEQITLTVTQPDDLPLAQQILEAVSGATPTFVPESLQIAAPAPNSGESLTAVLNELTRNAIAIDDISLRRPTLDEVFLQLTGDATTTNAALASTRKEAA